MLEEINNFLNHYEPIWLFSLIFGEGILGYITLTWVKKEYFYDEGKDLARKQKKTKTTKKTTTQPSGISVTEESTEISEGIPEQKVEPK
jgi:hypothetical protein